MRASPVSGCLIRGSAIPAKPVCRGPGSRRSRRWQSGPDDLVLYAPDQMAAADRLAATLMPSFTLMRNAGRAVARAALRLGPQRTLVLCGAGRQRRRRLCGGNAAGAAGLAGRGRGTGRPRPGSDAAQARAGWHGPVRGFDPERAAAADLVIDAVLWRRAEPGRSRAWRPGRCRGHVGCWRWTFPAASTAPPERCAAWRRWPNLP